MGNPRISRTSKAAVKSHFNFYTCMLHKRRKNNTGETGRARRVECNNSKSHNHFLSIELYGDRYSRRDGLCGGHPLAVREVCLERTNADVCVCVCLWCRGHQDFPVDVKAMTVTINKMGMTVIFAFMEGKSSNNVKSPFYRTVMALWDCNVSQRIIEMRG